MSPTPEAPAPLLLSGAELDAIRNELAEYLASEVNISGRELPENPTADDFVFPYTRDVRALLAHLDAQQAWFDARDKELCEAFDDYRTQVRDTLRQMLPPTAQLAAMDAPATKAMAAHYDEVIREAARALHLGEL